MKTALWMWLICSPAIGFFAMLVALTGWLGSFSFVLGVGPMALNGVVIYRLRFCR